MNWRNIAGAALPLLASLLGFALWRSHGFDALNEWEKPLAVWINSLAGRVDSFDLLVILLNNRAGEALCVLVIVAAYMAVSAWFMPRPTD